MSETKRVNLALQGGGSHGAFTWGVLDALIEDDSLAFEAVSGTSAGAMNAAILLQGWADKAGAETPLIEEYTYSNLRINQGLSDKDFDTKNAAYRF